MMQKVYAEDVSDTDIELLQSLLKDAIEYGETNYMYSRQNEVGSKMAAQQKEYQEKTQSMGRPGKRSTHVGLGYRSTNHTKRY